jgi:WYL domain-containing protein
MRAKPERVARDRQKSERLRFIDEELFWTGEITRRSIEEAFGVSEETAKSDLRDYRRGHAGDLKPDPHDNKYRVPIDFAPRIAKPDAEAYLDRLARRDAAPIAVAAVPEVDRRTVDRTILQSIVRAIRDGCEIDIDYRSPRAEVARRYRIVPRALLHDGFRWSVRSHIHGEAGDHWGEMVLDRIEEVGAETWPATAPLGGDEDWQSVIEVELMPNPGLDAAGRSLIEAQYGMENGRKVVPVRRCMLAYFLKRYQLDEPASLKAPHQAPLALCNRAMVRELLPPGMRVPLEDDPSPAAAFIQRLRRHLPELSEQAILDRALAALLRELEG